MLNYRRRLPHLHGVGVPLFVTWRLHGSVPKMQREAVLKAGIGPLNPQGPKWLADSRVAEMVSKAFIEGQKSFYTLHAWVIMPNHVHLLLTPHVPLPKIREANALLNRTGQPFWRDESFDRVVRDGEFDQYVRYIALNPVTCGLATMPESYPWSHAGRAG